MQISRRAFLGLLLSTGSCWAQQPGGIDSPVPDDWVCPMHPDVHSGKPGVCPRCGMALVSHLPDRIEYPLQMTQSPAVLKGSSVATLTFRVLDPQTGRVVNHFEIVHEQLMHIFLVSENLQFFTHLHPVLEADGSFRLPVRLPYGGTYRLLADYYPAGSVPQLTVKTLLVSGHSEPAQVRASVSPSRSDNLTASLRLDPEQALAGLETKLFLTLDPSAGLEPYLGAWAHMLAVSEDLSDLLD